MRAVVLFTVLNVLAITATSAAPVQSNPGNCLIMTPVKQQQIKQMEKQISELLLKLETQYPDMVISDVTININKYTEQEARKDINLIVSVNDCADGNKKAEEEVVYFEEPKETSVAEQSNKNTEENGVGSEKSKVTNTKNESNESAEEDDSEESTNTSTKEQNVNDVEESEVDDEESDETSAEESSNDDLSSENTDSNDENSTEKVINSVVESSIANQQDNDKTAAAVTKDKILNNEDTKVQVPVKPPGLKPCMEVVILELDEKEDKLVREMEKKRGNKPFLLIQHGTGEREIKFF